jgi:molybdenum cofactor guanylyltransferase
VAAGLLLTGGRSRRLGTDKSRVRRDGETLAARGARVLREVCTPVLELGPGNSGLDSVREDPPSTGPLAALAAGGAALQDRGVGDAAVLLAVDLPFVEPPLLALLAGRDPRDGAVVLVAGGVRQPTCALYSRAALDRAETLVDSGARALQALLDAIPVTELPESAWRRVAPSHALADVDTPADLRRLGLDGGPPVPSIE